jgi:hypothetical protein
MRNRHDILLMILLLSLMLISVARTNAQTEPQGEILPPQGPANTTILIRFTTLDPNVSNVQTADIFWDNLTIGLNQQFVTGANGISENYNLTPPAASPFSDVGNHTIRVDTKVPSPKTYSFIFNITESVPSPEYLALNATYYHLLANYTDIFGNFTRLQADFAQLSANYTTLQQIHTNDTVNYSTLIAQYNVLNTNYNSLTANVNLISTNYADLNDTYGALSSNYASLQASFQTLGANYVALNTSYTSLISNYNSVTGQLDLSRNINILLVIATIALLITTVYLAILKPKGPTKQR